MKDMMLIWIKGHHREKLAESQYTHTHRERERERQTDRQRDLTSAHYQKIECFQEA